MNQLREAKKRIVYLSLHHYCYKLIFTQSARITLARIAGASTKEKRCCFDTCRAARFSFKFIHFRWLGRPCWLSFAFAWPSLKDFRAFALLGRGGGADFVFEKTWRCFAESQLWFKKKFKSMNIQRTLRDKVHDNERKMEKGVEVFTWHICAHTKAKGRSTYALNLFDREKIVQRCLPLLLVRLFAN